MREDIRELALEPLLPTVDDTNGKPFVQFPSLLNACSEPVIILR